MQTTPQDILDFWFGADPALWFAKNDAFDQAIQSHFAQTHEKAASGALTHWQESEAGMLALILVLDQFSRNLYRGSPRAFACDPGALDLAQTLAARPGFEHFTAQQKMFAVMPMMHAEDLACQKKCLQWMEMIGIEGAIAAAKTHLDIIERFGRFPHRNQVLGRTTTEQEQTFLDAGGFAG